MIHRTPEEERAARDLKKQERREGSAESKKAVKLEDFEMLGMMGQGAYGKVFLALKTKGGKYYAVKAINKAKIMRDNKQHEIFRERQALITLNHPNIVKMYWSFNVRTCILLV